MFRFLAKSAIASFVWSKYRKMIVSTICLFLTYFLVSFLHDDYLEYAALSGDNTDVANAYLIKWSSLLLATIAYYYFNIHRNFNRASPKKSACKPRTLPLRNDAAQPTEIDPFANIRRKNTLDSKADKLLKD